MPAPTTVRKRILETRIEAFRTGDHETILSRLTDDVAWDMPPHFTLSGKAAFEGAIEHDVTPGLPDIRLTRLVEEGDVVVAEGRTRAALTACGQSTRCSATSSSSGTTRSAAS